MASARDFVICAFCNDVVRPASAFRAHLASDEHRERAEGNYVRCPVCKICLFPGNWTDHVSGASHRKNAERLGLRIHCDAEIPAAVPGRKRCNICKIFIPNDQWDAHLLGQHHAAKMRARDEVAGADAAIQRAKADKEGLSVSHLDGLDLGIVDIQNTDNYVRAELMVTTTSLDEQYELVGLKTKGLSGQGSASAFTAERLGTSSVVHPLSGLSISVRFVPRANFIGRYAARVELLFVNSTEGTHFMIVRDVSATAGDQHAHETLAPTAPYVAPARNRFRKVRTQDVVSGERELRHNPYKIKLKQYPIPQDLETALEGGSSDVGEVIARLPDALRPRPLENAHYAAALQGQLWVEEYKATLDMQVFDMRHRQLQQQGANSFLVVPGLAENRPSVVLGDVVYIQRENAQDGKWYEGFVREVLQQQLCLRFALSIRPQIPGNQFAVRFGFNRLPMRRQHQALEEPFDEDRVFFPVADHVKALLPGVTPAFKNGAIATNPAQKLAVETIMRLPPGSPPFVVFGPPGTGKTVTIVEAILQLLVRDPGTRILACAPSNSASDLITERLLDSGELNSTTLLRAFAPSRPPQSVNRADVRECALRTHQPDGPFRVPTLDEVKSRRVVVATCVGAAFPLNLGMERGHFTHIFVDEAAQASEPEAIVPIKGVSGPRTNIILSGDQQQLRPVIRSAVAAELGLGKSLLERLMERAAYERDTGRNRTYVKLVQNFRSHPRILEFPNRWFYELELEPCADRAAVDAFERWQHHPRPSRRFPIIFHAVAGQDEREATSPSYFNRLEAIQVKSYVRLLVDGGTEAKDIGVITPYHAQAKKIRQLLSGEDTKNTQVASVELFQGQERTAIIMSTVRSTQDLISQDLRHTLGFVGNPRRFNVAMTRAKALLIVVGDPAVLGLDPLWRSWLNFVYLNGGWTGSDGPAWDAEAEVREAGGYDREAQELGLADLRELTARMDALALGAGAAVIDEGTGSDDGASEVEFRDAE